MNSITSSRSHEFTFSGTKDDLVEIARRWRWSLPGKLEVLFLTRFYLTGQPGESMGERNADDFTTKPISRNRRIHIGAVKAETDEGTSEVRRITIPVSLMRYEAEQVPLLMAGQNLQMKWRFYRGYYGSVTVRLDSSLDSGVVHGWLDFPAVVEDLCNSLIEILSDAVPSHGKRNKEQGKPGRQQCHAHKRARERLRAGEPEEQVRRDWRKDYEEETGNAPEATGSGEKELWRNVKRGKNRP